MTALQWDKAGDRLYETGIDRGVLYIPDNTGAYVTGYAWNGLVAVTEKPSGAAANPQYADNIKYLNLISAEEFGADIEAFTYPEEFAQCDGTAVLNGIQIAQQTRRQFGFAYRTLIGNDLIGTDFGYKIHLIYAAQASPSDKARSTVNDKPEAAKFSWTITTTPVAIADLGTNPVTGKPFRPTAHITVDSTKVSSAKLTQLENMLYGTAGVNPKMPTPAEVLSIFAGDSIEVAPVAPTYTSATHTIVIPTVTGVVYKIDGAVVTGSVVITADTVVVASPDTGYKFPLVTDDDWLFEF